MLDPRRRTDAVPRITRIVGPSPHPDDNQILWSALDDACADAEIDAQCDYFRGIGHAFEWMAYGHDAPTDLVARLLAHGLVHDADETVMVGLHPS